MEKQEILRNSIKQNPNLSEEFKCNIGTLTDTLVTVLPEYDYSNYEGILSNLKIVNETLNGYAEYDRENNILKLDLLKAFEDRIDLQHLFLQEILKMRISTNVEGFDNGMSEVVASLMNSDESMKKIYPLESLSISLLSKVVDPGVLLDGFMNNDMESILFDLESKGISNDEFTGVVQKFNTINESFPEVEMKITNMFAKKVKSDLDKGAITYDDISLEFGAFENMLITRKSDLSVLYPHHDFSKVVDLGNVKTNLDLAVTNIESMNFDNARVK